MAKKRKPGRVPVAPRPVKKQATPFFSRRRVAVVAAAAAAVAIVLIGASLLSARDDGDGGGATTAITGGADVEALLDGIPHSGTVLGEDDAAVTLVEYADLQCPFCASGRFEPFRSSWPTTFGKAGSGSSFAA